MQLSPQSPDRQTMLPTIMSRDSNTAANRSTTTAILVIIVEVVPVALNLSNTKRYFFVFFFFFFAPKSIKLQIGINYCRSDKLWAPARFVVLHMS